MTIKISKEEEALLLSMREEKKRGEEKAKQKLEEDKKLQEEKNIKYVLEKQFYSAAEKFQKQIDKHIAAASAELKKAEDLSDAKGLPFRSSIFRMSGKAPKYVPKSFNKTDYSLLDEDFLRDVVYEEYDYYCGWQSWQSSSFGC